MIFKGIDKTKIKNFTIELMDMDRLLSNDNVIFQERARGMAVATIDGEIKHIDSLIISDGHIFNKLSVGVKLNKGTPLAYAHVDIHIAENSDNNLKPLKISEYRNRLTRLKSYLEDRYGLYINLDQAKFEKLEINVTSKMDRDFIEYEFLLEQMVYLVPKRYEVSPYLDDDREAKQYDFFNDSTEAKIYDKTRQLEEKFKISMEEQDMRIEYTLNKAEKIKNCLGSALISEVTDEAIESYLKAQIYKDLIKPIETHITKANKELLQMANDLKKADSRKWAKLFVYKAIAQKMNKKNGRLALVIDSEQIEQTIKKVSGKNSGRTIARIQSEFAEHPYLNDNLVKLQEIKDKFV